MTRNEKKTERYSPNREAVEVHCPKCQLTEVFYIPDEPMPVCPQCKIEMVFSELLKEGKYS